MIGGDEGDEGQGSFASPPCFMHELDPAYLGFSPEPDRQQRADVMRWRKAERQRLIQERLAIPAEDRKRHTARITDALDGMIGDVAGLTVSTYWPFRGEPDLRPWMKAVIARGGRCALPVVVERGAPMVFRAWTPGARLEHGIWNIPIPADGPEIDPDVVIAPVVGFDPSCYRLGYGGGFFDRTLAAREPRPRAIGIGYATAALATIYPQPHDIPMTAIVTQDGIMEPALGPA